MSRGRGRGPRGRGRPRAQRARIIGEGARVHFSGREGGAFHRNAVLTDSESQALQDRRNRALHARNEWEIARRVTQLLGEVTTIRSWPKNLQILAERAMEEPFVSIGNRDRFRLILFLLRSGNSAALISQLVQILAYETPYRRVQDQVEQIYRQFLDGRTEQYRGLFVDPSSGRLRLWQAVPHQAFS